MKLEHRSEGRARPPGGPERVNHYHAPPPWVGRGSMFFITVCCETRGKNLLCQPAIAEPILAAARHYHEKHDWYLRIMLLMPDHVHWLLQVEAMPLEKVVARMKSSSGVQANRILSRAGPVWQSAFHGRMLHPEDDLPRLAGSIVSSPLRAGLVEQLGDYPFWDSAWV